MDCSEFMHHWGYFCSLAERLDNTKHYIDHGLQQNEEGNMELAHGQEYIDSPFITSLLNKTHKS